HELLDLRRERQLGRHRDLGGATEPLLLAEGRHVIDGDLADGERGVEGLGSHQLSTIRIAVSLVSPSHFTLVPASKMAGLLTMRTDAPITTATRFSPSKV